MVKNSHNLHNNVVSLSEEGFKLQWIQWKDLYYGEKVKILSRIENVGSPPPSLELCVSQTQYICELAFEAPLVAWAYDLHFEDFGIGRI
ncbi:hypothetical protein GH714_016655 [Hevea brasiliensis]|uniref:Uncharacterized protein n=1 Tax=Hevea brasiliensis TaxID=3981 RepID=A0A6A6NHV9_HEVBR|nr:hypothetical protein GH714_016655 [Hevea brasiliensis]